MENEWRGRDKRTHGTKRKADRQAGGQTGRSVGRSVSPRYRTQSKSQSKLERSCSLPLGSTPPRCSQKDQQMKISMGWLAGCQPHWLLLV
ncbi:GL21602 [Drosophila persimilis]|uniref:GL21602 n=1 Tax=Drosophila persimilis TaxID=7234 RepID=B4GFM1_DROPE|nr:GL21602 [Drosophila persimilis]